MKCIRCDYDSKRKDRTNRICPNCKKEFAFEPQDRDPVTDRLFKNAIDAVSGGGRLRWGVEHLYYEVCRRLRPDFKAGNVFVIVIVAIFAGFFGSLIIGNGTIKPWPFIIIGLLVAGLLAARQFRRSGPHPRIDPTAFSPLWDRWCKIHSMPAGVIMRRSSSVPSDRAAAVEPDIGDYSFDRAVICDRGRTVDLLIANNYHFENNCAVLSADGYPEGPFQTIMTMLKRNPKLQVYALHDASPAGCALAHKIAYAPEWFDGKIRVIDLGLRPQHAWPFRGLLQPAASEPGQRVIAGPSISDKEAQWLNSYVLELAAVRPEQTLKRLFRGMQAHAEDDFSSGGVTYCGSFEAGADADGASADGADSFG